MLLLRQSTSVVINLGPATDKTDGVTLESGLVSAMDHATTGIRLSKNGGASAVRNGTPTTTVYDSGNYRVTLNTTDTNTLGHLRVFYYDAATLVPLWADFQVVTANYYDTLFSTDKLEVDVVQHLGTAVATPTVAGVPEVDVTHWMGTATPTPHTAGYPIATVKDGTGTGEIDTTSGKVGLTDGSIVAATIGADALTAAKFASDVATEFQNGLATAAALAVVDGIVDDILVDTAVIGALGAGLTAIPWNAAWDAEVQSEVADALAAYGVAVQATLVDAASVIDDIYDKTAPLPVDPVSQASLEIALAALNDITVAQIWNALTSGLTTANSVGKLIVDNLNATVGSRATQASVDDMPTNSEFSTALAGADDAVLAAVSGLSIPSASAVADAVWDEALAGHANAGSAGAALSAAGSAGDPWATPLPGSYDAGTAGKIVGDNLNATIGSRATQASVDDMPTNSEFSAALAAADDAVLAAIAALNNLSIANIRTAVGLASANLDTQLADLPTNAELAASQAASDDATLAAIAALNNLSAAQVNAEVDAALSDYDGPTNAELATALAGADDAVLAAIAALNNVSVAALWNALTSGFATSGSVGKLIVDNINATVSSRASQTSVDDLPTNAELATSQAAADDATLAAIGAITIPSAGQIADAVWDEGLADHLGTGSTGEALNDAGASATPPTVAEIADGVWDLATASITAANSIGKRIVDNLNATVSSRLSAASYVAPPGTEDIADAVWDEDMIDHDISGTAGAMLQDAGAAGDPWDIELPGAYASGRAGWILGTRLDARVSNSCEGSGSITFTYTLSSSVNSLPVAGASITVTSDAAGQNIVAYGETNVSGQVVFHLDAGTYYLWRQKAGWNFANPDIEVVS